MKIRVLNILTGGIMHDGITSSWLAFVAAFQKLNWINRQLSMDFVAIEYLSNHDVVRQFEGFGITVHYLPYRQKATIRYLISLIRLMNRGRYDIVHVNGSSNMMAIELLAARIAGVKVRCAHSRNTMCNNIHLHSLLRIPFRHLCNARLACGELAGNWLFGTNDFEIVNNGKDFSRFSYSEERRNEIRMRLGLKAKTVIGHVGKFNEQKNHRFLIRIFKEYHRINPDAILYLIGDGPLTDEIKWLVKGLNLTDYVIFTGAVDDVPERLQAMDFMLLPSLHEGFPNVVLEWQAMGLPAIISDTITPDCALTKLITFCSLDESPKCWANHIKSRLEENRNRKSDADIALANLKNGGFDINDSAAKLFDIYKGFL